MESSRWLAAVHLTWTRQGVTMSYIVPASLAHAVVLLVQAILRALTLFSLLAFQLAPLFLQKTRQPVVSFCS